MTPLLPYRQIGFRLFGLGILLACTLAGSFASAQDSIAIQFLYGSKPNPKHKATEPKWFGGKAGGHVGIAFAPDSVLNFVPSGKFHWIGHRDPKHSRYVVTDQRSFWQILGGSNGALKTVVIQIPMDSLQRSRLDQIQEKYLAQTPYDYAFLGMRCAAATHEVLAKLGITRQRSYWGTIFGTFHPKVLRRQLLKQARQNSWKTEFTPGSPLRNWQR